METTSKAFENLNNLGNRLLDQVKATHKKDEFCKKMYKKHIYGTNLDTANLPKETKKGKNEEGGILGV